MSRTEHTHIWLEPAGDEDSDEGRLWCQDNAWGEKAVKYVRADLVPQPGQTMPDHIRDLQERLAKAERERDEAIARAAELVADKSKNPAGGSRGVET